MDDKKKLLEKLLRDKLREVDGVLCSDMPCLGTPHDIARLIRAGYADMLCPGVVVGIDCAKGTDHKLPMVQLQRRNNACIMYDKGRCLLQSGLAPTLGRVHQCVGELFDHDLRHLIILKIIAAWAEPANWEIVEFCLKTQSEEQKKSRLNHTN